MCGRYALHTRLEEVMQQFRLSETFVMRPRYNIAPTETVPILIHPASGVRFAQWSFLPFWAKPEAGKLPVGYINARSETLAQKPAFRKAFSTQRCLVPATGYFEWKEIQGKKQPFYLQLEDQSIIAFAGVWSLWEYSAWEKVLTFAIITTPSRGEVARIHPRMPLVIQPDDYAAWLNPKTDSQVIHEILTLQAMQFWMITPVSKQVNNPKTDSPVCIKSL